MHREHAAAGHDVVHQREHAFFHLAGVFGAEDDHFAPLQANVDAGARSHLVRVRIGRELAGVVNHVIGLAEIRQFFGRGPNEHVAHEQRMVSPRANHAHFDPIARIPTGESVDHVQLLARVQIIDRALAVDDEHLLVELDVHRAPPNRAAAVGMIDNALIERTAAGFLAGANDQRAAVGNGRVLVNDRVFIQRRRRCVAHGKLVFNFVPR